MKLPRWLTERDTRRDLWLAIGVVLAFCVVGFLVGASHLLGAGGVP